MKPSSIAILSLSALLAGTLLPARAATATFDDLATPPAVTTSTGLYYANADSSLYQGVVWDSRFVVVGDEARVDVVTPGPLFGIPHSGHYFVTNGGDGTGNDGLLITTSMVLTGAWFGRNEYYGFGAGSDQVTINALGTGGAVLASVVFDLPAPAVAGQPGVMGFADTSSFASLAGITGYRIDRRQTGDLTGNWVADDFSFVPSDAVPEPPAVALLLAGLFAFSALRRASSGSPGRTGTRR